MNKVTLHQYQEQGRAALGVKVMDDTASLQDLLDAWQPLCDDTLIHKEYAAAGHDVCKACQVNCCNTAYVIPDLIAFKRISAYLGLNYQDFIRQYFQPEKYVAGLLRFRPDPCVFLQERICSIYELRSLICRFYICTPLYGDTEELIYKISWAGGAATQVFAEQQGLLTG
ncbi:MAG TPA: YkgJ family cysteine cluster protein, partial [Syntrophomonas sp.]|nr:YkgJ family cysteine cluster protein [Syntrophomonas sp.]